MGEMLVGPAAEQPQWVDKYKEERYMIKHQVRPD